MIKVSLKKVQKKIFKKKNKKVTLINKTVIKMINKV